MTTSHIGYTKLNIMAIRRFFINAKSYRVHVVCWLVFMLYENLLLVGLELKTPDFIALFVHAVANITFFYAFAGMISNWAWRADQHDWWRIPIGVILSLAVYIIVKVLLDSGIYLLSDVGRNAHLISLKIFSGYLYRGVFFILCALGYCYLVSFIKERNQKEQLLASYFNHQILTYSGNGSLHKDGPDLLYTNLNMHHLFSCLNFIYLKLANQDDNLALISLYSTNLVRYYINSDGVSGSQLEQALIQVKNLIKMDQTMFPQQALFHLRIEKGIENINVDASALIPITVLLLHFSTTQRNTTRGKFSIFMVNERLCLKGEDIQYIEEPARLKVEFEQLHHQILSHKMQVERFEFQIIHHALNFDILF
ncbi:hypothetical protein G6M26_20380 [Agrobacterium tumefaciens]|nr:hypothetical protein [Agrobacterium tumefaciens]NTE20896.1 hypothetical protein [Agrobacterium tumefaciens]